MKKFMKAIAFALVMCLALSTVAFADNSVPTTANEDKNFIVNVTEAGKNEQVALMVVEEGKKDFSNPLYINQQGADENGDTTFEAVLTNAAVESVDVYVGYAANSTDSALYVGTVKLTQPITEVAITKVSTNIVQGEDLRAQEQTGAGVAIELNVKEAPEGVKATQMIWAIRYTVAGGEQVEVKYSDPIDVSDYGIGSALEGSIKLGLAFLNGSELNNIDPVKIVAVDAIFLFVGDDFSQEVLTNEADEAKRAEQ